MGRKRITAKLTDDDYRKIEAMAGLGLKQAEIALIMGFSEQAFRSNKKINERIDSAYKKGRVSAKLLAVKGLGEQIRAKNLTAIIFYLKTQWGWSEHADIAEAIAGKVNIYLPDNGRGGKDGTR